MITSGPLTARSRLAAILLACACIAAPLGLIAQPAGATTTATGDVTVFAATFNSSPNLLAAGPDGTLWFTEDSANNVGRVAPDGTITEFPILTAAAHPSSIVAGPDGNVWFTESSASRIGRITPDGTITELPTPDADAGPGGIAVGPDGNLWFTEVWNGIVRMTPDGTMTEFATPTFGAGPDGIAAGPDGNLWFTEVWANNIGRIATDGTVTEYPLPTASSYPEALTAGPDGNLWFTTSVTHKVDRATTSGVITEFAMPSNAHPLGIASGSDGNLWVSTTSAAGLYRMTTAGAFTLFSEPGGVATQGVAAGPDGNVWFTDPVLSQIGRLSIAVRASSGGAQRAVINTDLDHQFVAHVDDGGTPVPDATVTFTAPDSGASGTFPGGTNAATAQTDSNGDATAPTFTANGETGAYIVTADVSGTGTASFNVANRPVPTISLSRGYGQIGLVSAAFGTALQGHVTDSNGPVVGATVTFTAPSAGASGTFDGGLTAVDVITDDSGNATAPVFTANATDGEYTVNATMPGAVGPTGFPLINTHMIITAASGNHQQGFVNTAFDAPLVAHVVDGSGPVTDATVTFLAPSSGASGAFANDTNTIDVVTDSNGDAAAPFTANAADGSYIVTADVSGAPMAGFTLTNDIGRVISPIAGAGQVGLVGTSFATALYVHVEDSNGPVPDATVRFTAPPSGASGTFAGNGTTVDEITDSSGNAHTPVFTANDTTGEYPVTASVLGAIVPATFTLTNDELTITPAAGTNQHAYTDDEFATQFVAHVVDHNGTRVVGVYVTFTPPSSGAGGLFYDAIGGGWIGASFAVATDSNGDATAPAYKANGTFGTYSVYATVDGAVPPGASFSMTNDERPTITSTAGDNQSAPIHHAFGTDLVAHLVKSTGPVVGSTVRFTAPDSEPTGTFTGSVSTADAVTDSNGDATAPAFTADANVGGPYSVTATSGGVLTPASFALTNDAAPDYQLLQISPSSNRADLGHAVTPALEVQIRDSFNAPVVGATVTFAAVSGPSGASGTFQGDNPSADVVTDGSGFATAPTFTANSTVGSYNVAATSPDSSQSVWFSVINQPTASTVPTDTFPLSGNNQPLVITAGPDGNMWFTESSTNMIGRITPGGAHTITEWAIPTAGSAPAGITLGPDGNLWFAERDGNKIGRITPGGVITEFETGLTLGATPFFIVAGPDGNLWFTEQHASKIGRITTAGVVTEFATQTPDAGPFGITSGPGGALWFTEASANKIGKITTGASPVVTEFTLATAGAAGYGMTQGSDGNLWFTEGGANKIGCMTALGVVTEFAIPTPSAIPILATLGADGNVWFTEAAGNRLGRVTPSGVITEFGIPTANAFPTGIASGPGGSIWFTEGNSPSAIARATIPVTGGIFGAKRTGGGWASAALVAPSTSTSLTPVVTVDSTNHGHLVYAGGDGIYYASRGSGPANWPAATKIPGTRTGDTQPSIVTKGTTVYVAFHRTAGTAKGIYVSTKVGAAGAWSTTSRAVLNTTAAAPSIGVDATGTVHVAWQQSTGIAYAKRTGTTWSAAVVIAGSAAGSLTPSLVVNQVGTASVRVAFSRPGTGIRLATRAAGGTWSSAIVTGTTSADVTPSLAIDKANKLYLVARRTGATAPGIYYFRNRTGVWVKQHVGGTVTSDASPSIAVNSFAATPRPQLAFLRTAGVYTSSATTGNFTAPTQTIAGTDTSPDIAIDSNGVNAYLAYGT